MTSSQDWPIAQGAADFLGQQSKRLGQEERRPQVRKASDLLGPGFAPFAVTIDDLNGDVAAFNGMFIVPPGTPGSPDSAKWWVGETIADDVTGGTQRFSTFRTLDAPHTTMMRGFSYAPDSPMRFYSAWQGSGEGALPALPLPLLSGFTGGLFVERAGPWVSMYGGPVWNSTSLNWVQFSTLPLGYRPQQEIVSAASPIFNTTTTYQYRVVPTGQVYMRSSATTGNGLQVPGVWTTLDPMPA